MKKNNITAGVFNAVSHVPCCVAPHIAAQSVSGLSHFMHSVGGVVFGGVAPPLVTWGVNAITNNFKKNKCDAGCDHVHEKKNNNPLTLQWWRENKTSLLVGYGMQVLGFGIDAMTHDHHGVDHHGHDHGFEYKQDVEKARGKKTKDPLIFYLT